MGEIQIMNDTDVGGLRVKMIADNGQTVVCNHIICIGYQLQW